MLKKDAIDHFGGVAFVANALGLTYQAVYLWPERVPEGRAYQLQLITRGKLRVDPSLYMNDEGKRRPTTEFPRQPVARASKQLASKF